MRSMITIVAALGLAVTFVPAILVDYEEVHEQYCAPENVSRDIMAAMEDCFQINSLDFEVFILLID